MTRGGLGLDEAWRRFDDVIAPASVSLAGPRFLAFIPAAPSTASVWMDAVVSAASFSGESWLEAAGPVHAENEVLALLADRCGLPSGAGGCFVSGGSAGNLSALAVAREQRPGAPLVVAESARASVANAAHLLGLALVVVPVDRSGRLSGAALESAIRSAGPDHIVVASAGSTNAGVIDDLAGIAEVTSRTGAWLHVDAAYGGAALLVDAMCHRFAGIERADSVIIDPHKWLFGPLGSCALLYRAPDAARSVHTQHAPYLDPFRTDDVWNPADHAFHLTRRASGLALWFALAVHGIDAHAAAVARGIELAQYAAERIRRAGPPLELVGEPELSVVLFRRSDWHDDDWRSWSRSLLDDDVAFVTPTRWRGETVGRLVFLHPDTPTEVIDEIVSRSGAT